MLDSGAKLACIKVDICLGDSMKKTFALLATILLTLIGVSPALAGGPITHVPEPMSMSLLAGGVLAIAAVKRMRRK